MSRADVKPLTHWAIGRSATLRFTQRDPALVRGVARLPDGTFAFTYDPHHAHSHPGRSFSDGSQ